MNKTFPADISTWYNRRNILFHVGPRGELISNKISKKNISLIRRKKEEIMTQKSQEVYDLSK